MELLKLLSINKQLRLLNEGFNNILSYSGKVVVRKGNIYYKVIIDDTITYLIDKKDKKVYNFYKRYVGSVGDVSKNLNTQITKYPKKRSFEPKVKLDFVLNVPTKGYTGKIFFDTWGYDMTINDFVQVVSETAKQVKVRKLKVQKNTDNYGQMGSEKPSLNNFSSKEFILIKDMFRGKMTLRGRNKADNRSQSVTWSLLTQESMPFNYMD